MRTPAVALSLALVMGAAAPSFAETKVITTVSGKNKVIHLPDEKNPWVTGIASALIPGVGQGINGDGGAGWLHFGANFLAGLMMFSATANGDVAGATTWGLARFGVQVYSIYDAASRSNQLNEQRQAILMQEMNTTLPSLNLSGRIVSSSHISF